MTGSSFSSKLDWASFIIFIAKSISKKIGALICSTKFLSCKVALQLYKSITPPYRVSYCHVWADAPRCYLDMLDKLQKRICRSVGPSFAASLEPLAHHRNAATLSFFYKYYLDVYLNSLNCFHFLILVAGPLVTQIGCIFLSAFLDVIRMSMSTCVYVFQLFLNSFPMSILSFYSSFSCKSIPRSGCSVFHEIKAI